MKKPLFWVILGALILCLVVSYVIKLNTTAAEDPHVVPAPAPTSATEPTPAPTVEPTLPPETAPAPTSIPEPTPTSAPAPFSDKPDIDITSWEYVLSNQENLLDKDFVPEVTELENGHYFDSRAVDALKEFLQGARDEGLYACLVSTYRSYDTQTYHFNNKVIEYGGDRAAAARVLAIPGASEHQTGLAADIASHLHQPLNASMADTALAKWMKDHCHEYGFILRYPNHKQEITGIVFEPWHFRYVGKEAAAYIMENDLCLEEFVALYQ